MKFLTGLILLASLASANPVNTTNPVNTIKPTNITVSVNTTNPLNTTQTPIRIKLKRGSSNTGVKIFLTNTDSKPWKLFKPATILDKAAVEKVAVYSNSTRVSFDGVRLRIAPQNLMTDEAFQTIKGGQTMEIRFDFGQTHDLGDSGVYDLLVKSGIPYAKEGTTEIAGVIPITSNTLKVKDVDTKVAALTRMAFHQSIKRTIVQADCQGDELDTVNLALNNCVTLAQQAANATSNDTRMDEYFKDTSDEAKYNVTDVFNKIAGECQSNIDGVSQQYCGDVYKSCSPGVLAYTVPAYSYMVNCPLYFSALPSLTTSCHGQDQTTTTLHEMTHLIQMKGTLDFGVYGYDAMKTLESSQNLNHADTYCLFANGKLVLS
ncbi:deuterolysin metalloprotease [Colletotrichum graminicola M1.001]|uniref:Neutral protease 2 n=1 Tax=Colletotrichum graminicola (strain M1.001 / M2 / FGSC 10212) TaxID=645133 RepID=E3QXF8_COLGM|nr:deuterolysin metalloprotease [Colletotrichum graminicola M1.001]EFQ35546.1 deuterolysin metalloprotease [Colletotrichum graminicola M1.001]